MAIIEIDTSDPNYPFSTEAEWLDYNNKHLEIICKGIIEWDGRGVSPSENLMRIKRAYQLAKRLPKIMEVFRGVRDTIEGLQQNRQINDWIDDPLRGGFDVDRINDIIAYGMEPLGDYCRDCKGPCRRRHVVYDEDNQDD